MSPRREPLLSAQVVLRSAGGADPSGTPPIDRTRLAEHLPAPEVAAALRRAFEGAGFEVGPLVGISFAITAPRGVFEAFFGHEVHGRPGRLELRSGTLPAHLRAAVACVVFPPPPDFGPREFAP